MEHPRSDIKADGMMYNSKVKSSNSGSESNTMDSFQDGGQQNMNLDRSQSDYVPPMDGSRVNSELNNYPHDSEEQSSGRTEYSKMNDNIPTSQYNSGFNRGNFGMGDQHGGLPSSSGGEFPPQNSNFSQYGQHNMRSGYPQPSRQGPVPSRGGMSAGGMGMMPPNFNSGQQRVMSGPTIQQQQSGPTPTLNQLLQNASSQRYPGGYGEYGMGQQKGMNDVSNSPGFNQSGNWGQQPRPGGGVGYPQMPGNQPFRNQMYDGSGPSGRRPPGYPPGPGGGSGGAGSSGPYGGPQQYSPNSHHPYPPMGSQANRMPSQPYPSQQQQQQQQPSSGQPPPNSSSPMPYPGGSQSPFMGQSQSGGQQQNANNSSSQAQNSPSQPYASPIGSNHGASPSPRPQPSPSPQNSDKTQHNSNSQDGLTSDESNGGEVNSINSSNHTGNSSGVTTPTSSGGGQGVPHPAVSALRPIPSPAGSSGSRSNTPASVSGNQAGSPMPPRPPSAHMEGPNRIQSPMANQGYMPPMMPPPAGMSGNQMGGGGYPTKPSAGPGPHPGMMGPGGPNASAPNPAGMPPSHMQPGFSQHNSQYPNQPGQYTSRGPGGMGGYGGHNNYSSPGPMGNVPMYPNNMNPMGRPGPGGYPNSYPQSGPMNSHYNNYNNQQSMGPGPNMSNSMQPQQPQQQPQHPINSVPPNQQSPGPKGAQAAAQAAMIAAANSAANRSLFARQQLESQGQGHQAGPGSGMASQPPNSQGQLMPPEGNQPPNAATPVTSADMPPPSSTPSTQPTDSNSNHHRPPVDENSMSSTCSDDTQPQSRGKDLSHPATPVAPSPSASQSSIHDDDNISSPSWPGTPSSHTQLQQKHEGAMRLYDMGEEPERRPFLERLFSYMDEKGTPITAMPMISKQPIDLYRLYVLVKERGGLLEVTKTKKWREISAAINVGSSGSAGFTLRKNYIKHLFPFECKFDNGGMDPNPVLAQIEAMTQKKESKRPASANANQGQNSNNGPPADPYQGRQQQPSGYEGYPGQRMPGIGGEMHGPAMMPPPNQGMMHNNMPPHYEGSMMNQSNMPPNTSVMPNNGMMPNSRGMMPNNSMMPGSSMANSMSGGQMMPNRQPPPNMMSNNGEGMNNQNFPEGQGMGPPGQHYGRGYNSSGNMQGGNMPNSYPPYNRPGSMPPYQQGQPQQGSYPEGMNRPSRPASSNEQYSGDPYRRNSSNMMPGQQGPPAPTSTTQGQESYNSQSSSYPSQQSSSSSQYPSYPGPPSQERSQPGLADKLLQKLLSKKYDQQAPSPSSQPPSQPPSSSSPMLPASSQGPDAPNTPTSSSSFSGPTGGPPRPYPSQQMMPNRPPGHGPPDANYPGPNASGQPYPRPAGFSSQGQEGNFNQSNYPTPTHPQGQQPMYGQKPGQPLPGFQGQKQYPGFQRDGYNVPPGYPSSQATGQQYGYNQPRPNMSQESMQPDMRSSTRAADGTWSGIGQRSYPPPVAPTTGPPSSSSTSGFTTNSSSSSLGQSMPPTAANVPPYSLYNRINARMSPMKPDLVKPFTPQKMPKQSHSFPKKEIVFPPDSVEAVNPLLQKRKKLNAKDVAPIDPWKLMMALKSGLLAQSTWALDTLSILLYDDNAVLFFNLAHLPGLLDVLLTHWRHYLIDIFSTEFEETELTRKEVSDRKTAKRFKSLKEEFEEVTGCKIEETNPEAVDTPDNFTYKTRQGRPVKVVEDDSETNFDIKSWDVCEGFESSAMDWKMGRGDTSYHVITQFQKSDTLDFLKRNFYGPERFELKASESQKASSSTAEASEANDENDEEEKSEAMADSEIKTEKESDEKCGAEQEIKKESDETENSVDECEEKMDTSSDKENMDHNVETTLNGPVITKEEKPDSPMPICAKDQSLTSCIKKEVPEGKMSKEPYIEPDDNAQDATEVPALSASQDSSQKTETEVTVVKVEKIEPENESCENSKDSGSVKPDEDREEEEVSLPQIDHEERRQRFLAALQINKETAKIIEQVKRKREESQEESEAYHRDPPPLFLISDSQEELGKRCVCVSNIIRSLSFVPGNDRMMSTDRGLLRIISKLLLLHHTHPKRRKDNKTFDREEDASADDSLDDGREDWWWSTLHALRENALVILANIAGQLNLTQVPEEIVFPLLDSLLHWAVCPSSCAHDPLPSMSANSVLSPQRLVLETMCKLCVTDGNVDLLLATPPYSRTMQLFSRLINLLANRKEQVLREFSIVLLSSLVRGDTAAARTVALQHPSISLLLDFIETAEHQAMQIAQSHGVDMLKDNPEMMGTSLGMLRRAAVALQQMAAVPDNRPLFLKQQDRLLTLVMSHVLDQTVTSVLADVLYLCSQDPIFS